MIRFVAGKDDLQGSLDIKGNYYITLTQAGPKEEAVAPDTGEGAQAVWASYWDTLSSYLAENRAAVVEWRKPPTLIEEDGRYWVRSRLSIIETE